MLKAKVLASFGGPDGDFFPGLEITISDRKGANWAKHGLVEILETLSTDPEEETAVDAANEETAEAIDGDAETADQKDDDAETADQKEADADQKDGDESQKYSGQQAPLGLPEGHDTSAAAAAKPAVKKPAGKAATKSVATK